MATRNNKADQAYLTLSQFAFQTGLHGRKIRESSAPFHTHFLTLDPEGQKAMRVEYIVGHLEGQGYSAEDAAWIAAASRTERAREDQQAYDRARGDFAYHVEQTKGAPKGDKAKAKAKANKAEVAPQFEIPTEVAALAQALVRAVRAYDLDDAGLKAMAAQAVAAAFAAK
jgi:hypothetical protein